MPITITPEQVLALAPDAPSVKAARSLATPRPWSMLGRDDRAIWGACLGSGKDPYLTQVDWQGPAFKCSCPSRKFPCKHGLALLLLLAEQPRQFTGEEPPDWVAKWLASRSQRTEPKVAAPVDEAARVRRVEQRASRVAQGLDELELWLRDLVQQGLASAPSRGFEFWDRPAARLVDAQAPGAARRVRDLASVSASGDGWQNRMVDAIGQLTLLIHAYRRLDALPALTQSDVRAALGLQMGHEEVLATEAVRDLWMVAGQRISQEERLRVQRSWIIGAVTGRLALILDFAPGAGGFKNNLLAGSVMDAEICFFPSAAPLRALIKAVHGTGNAPAKMPAARSLAEAFYDFGTRSAANPWTEIHPVPLRAVVPVPGPSYWTMRDEAGAAIPSRPDFCLLAISGGRPIEVFGEWDGYQFLPLLAASDGRFSTLCKAPLA